jgi:hypothetical protein
MYTLGAAARATGKSKATISRAIKAGRLSAARSDDGGYAIDPSELSRVYPATGPRPNSRVTSRQIDQSIGSRAS